MRLVTKAVLILSLIALCIFVLYITGPHGSSTTVSDAGRPRAHPPETAPAGAYDDPLAASIEKWREQLKNLGPGAETPAPGAPPAKPKAGTPAPDDLKSSATKEGVAAALPKEEVVGADPPGPFLRPETVKGQVLSPVALAARPKETGRYHEVREGDTLGEIARHYYGNPNLWTRIEEANPGINPTALRIGARILVPEASEPKAAPPAGGPKIGKPPAETQVYVIRDGDTLIGIARRIYGNAVRYMDIYEANRDVLASPDATLYAGQRLRIPPK
jgi:nucleoid-associated protein YgaU